MNNGKICISVCSDTADELIAQIRRAEELADMVEVRFDCLPPTELDAALSQIERSDIGRPLLATYRSPDQGGHGIGTLSERKAFWTDLSDQFWGGDLEEDVFQASTRLKNKIASFHNFSSVPDDIDNIFERLSGSKIIKIAVKSDDITDTISVWKLLERAKTENKQIIPIAMGEAGKWTRILGVAHGAYLTYASIDAGKETADGQITAKDLIETYRVKDLDKNTKVFGVIGEPVSQSLSPYMHNPSFASAGVNAVFVTLLVKNIDEFIRRMVKAETREVELNFGGFSVTMPYKQSIITHLDAIDPTAEKIGAVNTVNVVDGKLLGYNTDAHGFITPLKAMFGDLQDARVAIFGAGGASRACVYALKDEGADVTVFARDISKAETLAEELGVRSAQLTTDNRQLTTDIVVDATPIGMKGPLENETLFTADELAGVKFVYDLVTKSTNTPLICEANKAGIPALGGIEMLLAQGAKQFEIWTGQEASTDRMRDRLLARMTGEK